MKCAFCRQSMTSDPFCCERVELEALRRDRARHAQLQRAVDRAIHTLRPVATAVVLDDGGVAREVAALTMSELAAARSAA